MRTHQASACRVSGFRRLLVLPFLVTTPFTLAASLVEAEGWLRGGKIAEARAAYQTLLNAEPRNATVHAGLGEVALRERRLEESARHFGQAIALEPQTSQYHARLGTVYGLQAAEASLLSKPGLASKSRKALEKAVALDPKDAQAVGSLFTFYLVAPGFLGGSPDKALKLAHEFAPHQPFAAAMLEAAAHEHGKRWAEAERALERAQQLNPQHHDPKIRLGQLHVKSGQPERAFSHFETLAANEPANATWRYHFGRTAVDSGQRLEEGISALLTCLETPRGERGPAPAEVHWRIGLLEERRGNAGAARIAYQQALDADPQFRRAHDSLQKLK